MIRHFLSLAAIPADQLRLILATARNWKNDPPPDLGEIARDKTLIMLFDKPSTRTRLSFEIAFNKLGGAAICLERSSSQMSRGEPIEDTFSVFSRYGEVAVWRAHKHEELERAAAAASVPVINALTDRGHPCQIVADLLTLTEKGGGTEEQTVLWFGDCNNVARSWVEAANVLGFRLALICPKPLAFAESELGGVELFADPPAELLEKATCIATDTWFSMSSGRENVNAEKRRLLQKYQVNAEIMAAAKKAVFMHCLPATRGQEVAERIIESERSVVWRQSENRIHAQKAILAWCLGKI